MRCVSQTFLQGGAILNTYIIFLLRFCLNDAKIILFDNNLNEQLTHNEVVLVNFYADWCRFSQQLKPIFESASNKFDNEPPGKVAFVSIDCDRHSDVCSKYNVNKYPTLKLFRNGELIKKEYRGQRSADAIAEYIQKQAEVKVGEINSLDDLNNKIDNSKNNVIGFFKQKDSAEHKNFLKVASALRDDCTFHAGTGDWISSVSVAANAPNSVIFKERVIAEESPYTGRLDNYNQMKNWLGEKCTPLVREITYENAEELTEEGIPFLILFRNVGDTVSEKIFSETVFNELSDQRTSINCLVADGKRFIHPLHHLGKSEKNLPVIAIDSFRHMYLFPDFSNIKVKGSLRQFAMDLHAGKLHREFHHGPDTTQKQNDSGTQPPESIFKQLKPSKHRYSLLQKEEL